MISSQLLGRIIEPFSSNPATIQIPITTATPHALAANINHD